MKSLLDDLMQAPELKDFVLIGGTCLALRLGHRSSVDLDMFTSGSFDPEALAGCTQKKFPESKLSLGIIPPNNHGSYKAVKV